MDRSDEFERFAPVAGAARGLGVPSGGGGVLVAGPVGMNDAVATSPVEME